MDYLPAGQDRTRCKECILYDQMEANRWPIWGARISYHYHKHTDDAIEVNSVMGKEDVGVV